MSQGPADALKSLFNMLKNDTDSTFIDKSSLFTLLKHINLQNSCKYFFVYLRSRLQQLKEKSLDLKSFRQLFINPEVDFSQMSVAEISELFTMFDNGEKGFLLPEDILRYYRESEEFKSMSKDEQKEYLRQVESDFKMINSVGRLGAEDFQKILNSGRHLQ